MKDVPGSITVGGKVICVLQLIGERETGLVASLGLMRAKRVTAVL
jgi:hypothetical protein